MKRTVRRILAITAGIVLGWYIAGFAPSLGLGTGTSLAADSAPADQPPTPAREETHAAPAAAEAHSSHEVRGANAEHRESEERDPGQIAADRIVPGYEFEISWYRPVVMGIVLLFILAVVLGYPALKLQAPPPPDPAADDHAHDDHTPGSGSGSGGHATDAHAEKPAATHAH